MNLRDAFGNAAKYHGDSKIHLHSPELLQRTFSVSDTELAYELSSTKVIRSVQVWVQRLIPSGLHATVYSGSFNAPYSQYLTSSLDLPCNNCLTPLRGNYTYRFITSGFVQFVFIYVRNCFLPFVLADGRASYLQLKHRP